jgi:hypothetical protein
MRAWGYTPPELLKEGEEGRARQGQFSEPQPNGPQPQRGASQAPAKSLSELLPEPAAKVENCLPRLEREHCGHARPLAPSPKRWSTSKW